MCGGTGADNVTEQINTGLSPRVRGNRKRLEWEYTGSRSIPACAGEPTSIPRMTRTMRVYPRVCGGTMKRALRTFGSQGLSPRVRGNRTDPAADCARDGSIPACAGEPRFRTAGCARSRVYPRVCGGTAFDFRHQGMLRGLSPRVRGNPGQGTEVIQIYRSIPACAGEPWK